MIDFINKIFLSNGYGKEDSDSPSRYSYFSHSEFKDFWIVKSCRSQVSAKDLVEAREKAKSILGNYKEFEKNASLLILLCVDEVSDQLIDKVIKLEEDPFDFKKYVVVYTESDKEELLKIAPDGELLSTLLMNIQTFEELKKEECQTRIGPYHLLYSLAHKLPFLMMEVTPVGSQALRDYFIPSDKNKPLYEWFKAVDENTLDAAIRREAEQNNGRF